MSDRLIQALALIVCLGPASAPGQATAERPKELLAREPFDRITLIDNTAWEIEPLAPRPLPPFDPKKKTAAPRPSEAIFGGGNIGAIGQKSKVEAPDAKSDEEEGATIVVHMLEGDVRDFKVKRVNIKAIDYFEDLLVEEADRLIGLGKYAKAFEYLMATGARQPGWPKLAETVERLLFEEGSQAFLDGDGERGLRLLGDLYTRRPDYPGLGDKLAGSFEARIKAAVEAGAFAKGRQVLRELAAILPAHLTVKNATALFVTRAEDLASRARAAGPSDRLDLVLAAASIWPKLPGLDPAYREAFAAIPTLSVAVRSLPTPVGPWIVSPGSARAAPLLFRPLLASTDEASLKGERDDQVAAGVETFELGRGLRVRIKRDIPWGDGSRPVSAIDVARSLADRAVSTSPGYSARWADLVEAVEATEDDLVTIRLSRPSLHPESWLTGPVGPAHAGPDGWVSTVGGGRRPVGDGRYQWLASSPTVDQYLAVPPGPAVRRLREVRHASPDAALAAFAAGEVALIDFVPPGKVEGLKSIAGVRVGRYLTPSVHRINLDGRTRALRNRALRRGLSLAIDRKTLLDESILRHPPDAENAVADGVFLRGSYADVADVEPLGYNPLLAAMLVAAAKKELGGGAIRLTFEYPPTEIARAVIPKLVESWGLIGVEVVGKEVALGDLVRRLRDGGRFDLAYLESRPGDPSIDAAPMICPGYDAPPSHDPLASVASPRILQLLLQLDRAPEVVASQAIVRQLDRESRDELPVLPLWQVVDHYAHRGRLRGPAAEIRSLYDGIASWEFDPWYPDDP